MPKRSAQTDTGPRIEPAWTPGPWKTQALIEPYAVAIVQGEQPGFSTRSLSQTLIAEFPIYNGGIVNPHAQEANATLCCAALSLYEALALYVEHFGDPLNVARKALAKARGEQADAK